MNYETIKKGVVKRTVKRVNAIFIDGIALDRAAKRLNRKIELSKLVQSLSNGTKPTVARYYTIIPYEDDSRHRAYLDAMCRAGLEVVIKRLPPKGVNREIDVYPEMAADIVAFGFGHHKFSDLSVYKPESWQLADKVEENDENGLPQNIQKCATIVCPAREISYPILLVKELGVDTISADFADFAGNNVLKNAAKWIDLSDAQNIWRE